MLRLDGCHQKGCAAKRLLMARIISSVPRIGFAFDPLALTCSLPFRLASIYTNAQILCESDAIDKEVQDLLCLSLGVLEYW